MDLEVHLQDGCLSSSAESTRRFFRSLKIGTDFDKFLMNCLLN